MSANKIAPTAVIYPNVKIGENCIIEDFCVIGAPLRSGETPVTEIGDHAHIRSFTVIYSGNKIGSHFQTGNKANIREFNQIGNHVSIGTLSVVEHHVVIEDQVRIHTNAFVPEYSLLKSGCWIGPHVVLTNAKFPNQPETKNQLAGVTIESGAVIGANSTISPGVIVAEKSLIGSGSNVTRSTEKKLVYVGNPARLKK